MPILYDLTTQDVVAAILKDKPKIKPNELVRAFEQHLFWIREFWIEITVMEIRQAVSVFGLVLNIDNAAEAVGKIDFHYAIENYPDESEDAETIAMATAYYLAFLEWHQAHDDLWHQALDHFNQKEAVYWIDVLTQPKPIQLALI